MKIKRYTKILATAYILWGLVVFFIMPYFRSQFSEAGIPLPTFSRAVLAVGPFGWLLVASVFGALVVLKDFRFRSRFLNPIFTVFLALLVTGITFAVAVVWVVLHYDTMSA